MSGETYPPETTKVLSLMCILTLLFAVFALHTGIMNRKMETSVGNVGLSYESRLVQDAEAR